jgi:phospholipid/cholesterol/gamma-HCH transport system substrate-binding protein
VETRSNKILVFAVVGLVLAAVIAFSWWLTASKRSTGRQYDIVLEQSVSGLLAGSPVTYSGVPVGRILSVQLDPAQAGRVRVRIDIFKDELPIPQGTVAKLNGDLLFGTALISLEPSQTGGPPLVAKAGEEVPVITVEQSGLANLASDPTPMIESISYATDRLLAATTPAEQKRIAQNLVALEASTKDAAAQTAGLGDRIAPMQGAIRANAAMSAGWAARAAQTRRNLEATGSQRAADMRATLANARAATAALDEKIAATRPMIQGLTKQVAQVRQQISAARAGASTVTEAARTVNEGGVGLLVSGPPTPDYQAEKK